MANENYIITGATDDNDDWADEDFSSGISKVATPRETANSTLGKMISGYRTISQSSEPETHEAKSNLFKEMRYIGMCETAKSHYESSNCPKRAKLVSNLYQAVTGNEY